MAKKKRGGTEVTAKKQAYVKLLVKKDKGISMLAAGKKVKAKFGTMLASGKLRDAFVAGGGTILKRGPGKGSKKTGSKFSTKMRAAGRRKSDRAATRTAQTLSGLPRHIIIVRSGRTTGVHEFMTMSEAATYSRAQIEAGISLQDIGYYTRHSLALSIGI